MIGRIGAGIAILLSVLIYFLPSMRPKYVKSFPIKVLLLGLCPTSLCH